MRQGFWLSCLVCVAALAAGLYSQWPAFQNPYIVNDDAAQHIYWMHQFQDPELFQKDLLTTYAKSVEPWGPAVFYRFFAFLGIDPLALSKALPVALLALSALLLFHCVGKLGGTYAGLLAAIIFSASPFFMDRMVGGHPRAFGYPLLIFFIHSHLQSNWSKVALALLLQVLFYPMIFLVCGLTHFLSILQIEKGRVSLHGKLLKSPFFIPVILLGVILLFGKQASSYDPSIGTLVSRSQMENQPEFYEGGRLRLLPVLSIPEEMEYVVAKILLSDEGLLQIKVLRKESPVLFRTLLLSLLILGLVFLWEIFRRKIFLPPVFLYLVFSSVACYQLASFFLMKLFVPERYVSYSLMLLGLIFMVVVWDAWLKGLRSEVLKKILQSTALFLTFLFMPTSYGHLLSSHSEHAALYDFLARLPKQTLIAAHPHVADGIPLFARRKVLVNYELSHPWFHPYWQTIKQRTYDFFDAYYAEDPKEIGRFCRKHSVDYLVAQKEHFLPDIVRQGRFYFEPFNTYLLKRLSGKEPRFALSDTSRHEALFEDDLYLVFDCDTFRDAI